mgnify:CR=1 FL=1
MENIQEIQERHRKEIENLQKSCSHSDISNFVGVVGIPGSSYKARFCHLCGKEIEKVSESVASFVTTSSHPDNGTYFLRTGLGTVRV